MNPREWLTSLIRMLQELLGALPRLLRLIRRRLCEWWEHARREDTPYHCLPIPAGVWIQPDAYLYSQRYLMSLGMAVTWDNPDVTLTDSAGNVVGSHDLMPSTDYRIAARIHNRSADAPAPGMSVVFTLLSFGAGVDVRQTLGIDVIDLPVRAAPGEPATAAIVWRTPPVPDHYCIEIEAVWPDDAFPPDNVGQHNTVVQAAPRGSVQQFRVPIFAIRKATRVIATGAMRVRARLDGYTLPAHPFVPESEMKRDERARRVREGNQAGRFAVPEAWQASLSSSELEIDATGRGEVVLSATVPSTADPGTEQRLNIVVDSSDGAQPIGGVTVILRVT